MYNQLKPDYFVITELDDARVQTDLLNYLKENFPVAFQKSDYIIFDLSQNIESNEIRRN